MYKKQYYIIPFLIFFLISLISCKNDLDEIRALSYKEELPDITVKNLHTEYSINGRTQVKLITPLAYRYTTSEKEYSLFPEGISLNFYDKNRKLHSSLKADYGIYYESKNFAKAKGNVILTNVNGSVLTTDELFVDEKEEKIYSVKPVNIKDKDGFEITGKGGFESNLDFTIYRFTDVKGIKFLNEEEEDLFSGEDTDESKSQR